jgi:hypothetical protein
VSGSPSGALDVDLSGVGLRFDGLAADLARRVAEEWRAFLAAPRGEPFLHVTVEYAEERAPQGEYQPKQMRSSLRPRGARFWMPEGSAEIGLSGRARIRLSRELGRREYYTLVNLTRACLAWLLPGREGMLLHAAGLIVGERAFLLAGAEGSGKSTWARAGEEGGARVLSDDLVLVDGAGERLEALGAPFRSTHEAVCGPGRWPLAAILFPRHGSPPAAEPTPGLLASARLTANLTFVAEAVGADPRLDALLQRVAREIPCADLTFAPDPSFLQLLRRWPS